MKKIDFENEEISKTKKKWGKTKINASWIF